MELLLNVLFNGLGVLVATLILIIAYFKWRFTYWKNLGIENPQPTIPFGNVGDTFLQKTATEKAVRDLYSEMKSKGFRHFGIYFLHMPIYIPMDLDLIKHIMQTDFVHFMDHMAYVNEKDDPFSASLFTLGGQKWKKLRNKLTPTFTSGKMKSMFPVMVKVSQELVKVLDQTPKDESVEAKDICMRYTTDIIGSVAFGIDCNSLLDPETEFRIQGKRIFNPTPVEMILSFLAIMMPDLMRLLRVRLFPKEATDFFWKVIKETTEYREKNNVRRNDVMQLLLDMKNQVNGDSDTTLTYNELAGQAFLFFSAGYETSSTLMSFAILELAINVDIQEKLRDEIITVLKKNGDELTYDGLAEMHYLDMVVCETLRKYAPIPTVSRVCTKDYRIPGTNVILPKGQKVMIPVPGLHYDPEYYPDPDKFDPPRFNEENRNKRPHFTFLPFGEGPRACIGLRFGMMQAKVGISAVIKNFKLKINKKTELPIKIDPKSFITSALGGIHIDLERIN